MRFTLCACALASHLSLADSMPGSRPSSPAQHRFHDHAALPNETPCFVVDTIVLSAPTELPAPVRARAAAALPQDPFAFGQAWLDHYRGHCIGEQGVQTLIGGVSRAILDRGYLTSRILVPEQDLATGTLRLALIPGVVGELRFVDPDTRGSWKTALPTRSGELLRLSDLEQGLEQMKRVASQEADMQLVPTDTPGISDVVISMTQGKPWTLVALIDDAGSRSTGKRQGNLTLGIDGPLGLNDMFQIGYGRDVPFHEKGGGTAVWNGSYSLPLGYWTATLSAYGNSYFQRVAGVNHTFVFAGESQGAEAKLHRVVRRARNDVLGLQWRFSRRFGKSYIEDTEIAQQRRNNSIVEFGITDRHHFGAAQLDATLAYRQGVGGLGAQADTLAASDGPAWQFRMAVADANLSVPLRQLAFPLQYVGSFRGQFTNHRLYFVDAMSIGGRHTVRGFDGDSVLSGDSGFHWRNELQMPIMRTNQSAYTGLDYGRVYGPSAASMAGKQLAGAVVGLRGGLGRRPGIGAGSGSGPGLATYDIFVGTPVYKPRHLHTAAVSGGFQLMYQY